MKEKPAAGERDRDPKEKTSQPPRESVSLAEKPEAVVDPHKTKEHQDKAREEDGPTVPSPPKRQRDIFDVIAAGLGALTLGVLILNACLIKQGHELTRNDQRAWVGPEEFGIPVIEVGAVPSISVTVTNHGNTPAEDLQKKSTYAVFAEGLHPEPQYTITDPREPSKSILFPGERQVFYATYDRPLTAEEVRDIQEDTRPLHLFVEITYKDFFGKPRRTALAQRLVRSPSDPSRWKWRILGYYNAVK